MDIEVKKDHESELLINYYENDKVIAQAKVYKEKPVFELTIFNNNLQKKELKLKRKQVYTDICRTGIIFITKKLDVKILEESICFKTPKTKELPNDYYYNNALNYLKMNNVKNNLKERIRK